MGTRHILSIDGGGVRGLVAAIVLDALDGEFKAAGKTCSVSECFDLIAGTSSGAVIAAALAMPGRDGGRRRYRRAFVISSKPTCGAFSRANSSPACRLSAVCRSFLARSTIPPG